MQGDPAYFATEPATGADIIFVLALKDACIARMRADGIEQWDEVYPTAAGFARDLTAGTLHVLREGGGLLACVTLDTTHDPLWQGMDWSAAGEPAAAMHRLMVHPAAQGRGLAKQLMVHAESLARAQGFRSIHLDCFTANPGALALYERLGYRRTGTATMRKGPFVCFEKLLTP
jgi:ribosomal protein S18 acetylase RimI-like enzyme